MNLQQRVSLACSERVGAADAAVDVQSPDLTMRQQLFCLSSHFLDSAAKEKFSDFLFIVKNTAKYSELFEQKREKNVQVPPRFELGSQDSKS